jgi:hypothetical protein
VFSSSLRPEPTAEAPLLQSACNESDAPLANVVLMKLASRQADDSNAMRRRCDAAMRRRCDHCDSDMTAMRPRRRRCIRAEIGAESGAESGAVCAGISCKIQQDKKRIVTHTAVGICRHFLHIVGHIGVRAAHRCADICKYVVLCLEFDWKYTCKYLPLQVHILLSQLQMHAHSDSNLQKNKM